VIRYLRYFFLAVLAICLVTLALANREVVTLHILAGDVASFVDLGRWGVRNSIDLPLFLVIFASIVLGLLIGFIWEWMREHHLRSEASSVRRDKERLEREVGQLREKSSNQKDDVLALLEGDGQTG